MNSAFSSRRIAWLAGLVMLPGFAGPGAVVAMLAAIESFGADHAAHHVSIQQDVGHDDFVLCHDARESAAPSSPAIAASDCTDDHRLHAADTESLVSRHYGPNLVDHAPLALAAVPVATVASRAFETLPASGFATFVACRHHRTIVLLL